MIGRPDLKSQYSMGQQGSVIYEGLRLLAEAVVYLAEIIEEKMGGLNKKEGKK